MLNSTPPVDPWTSQQRPSGWVPPIVTSVQARVQCEQLGLTAACAIAAVSSIPWVRDAVAKDPDRCVLGETYSFKVPDSGVWWARYLLVGHPDGRSALLSLVPRMQGDGWICLKKG